MLVRFKAPKWMRIISRSVASQQEFDLPGFDDRQSHLKELDKSMKDSEEPRERADSKRSAQPGHAQPQLWD
jgi:hypothetical protein